MRQKGMRQDRSKFSALENHFLNTYFSGLYISASDLIAVSKKVGLSLQMNSREQLIKELLNQSYDNNILEKTSAELSILIDSRIHEYQKLSMNYQGANGVLSSMINRANSTKALLAREQRGSVYDN